MEEEKTTKRVVVWKNEWAPVRRFIRSIIDKKNEYTTKIKETNNKIEEMNKNSSKVYESTVSSTVKTTASTFQNHPEIILSAIGLFTFGISKKCKLGKKK